MMSDEFISTEVLITVMTYPHPSRGYQELVCTAGITKSGDWVRLYPIDYRYRPRHQQFRKYQWIEVGLRPRGAGNDSRKESREPDLGSIRILSEPLNTKHEWAARRAIIDAMPHYTRNELVRLHELDRTSLGIVRPSRVLDLKIEPADPEWKPEWQAMFSQLRLFGPPHKPLQKIPYKFSYVFECEDSVKPHSAMIEDWELGMLFLHEMDRLGSANAAAESVRSKFLGELCRHDKDTRLFMGTVFPYNTWVVIGVFWPPKLNLSSANPKQGALPL
jgi:hypothetical protein